MSRSFASTQKRFPDDPDVGNLPRQRIESGLTREGLAKILAAIAVFALSGVLMFGAPASGLFVAASAGLMVLTPGKSARSLLQYSPFLLLPLLALVSIAWSDAPGRTARAGLQLLVTVSAAIAIANTLSARTMILTLFAASIGTCAIALVSVPEALASGTPLTGPFATKNPMGFAMELALGVSFALMVDSKQPFSARFLAIPVMVLATFLLTLARSGNAFVGSGLLLAAIFAFLIARKLNLFARVGVILFLLALAGVALVFLSELQLFIVDFVENVLKKDMTLTGRTLIWEAAEGLIANSPGLGHGYYAFWRIGNVEAEALWRQFGIANRSGFNFHSAFVEIAVDLGWVGLTLLLAMITGIALMAFYRFVSQPTVPGAFFFALMIAIIFRSYTESGLTEPFGIFTVLWVFCSIYTIGKPGT